MSRDTPPPLSKPLQGALAAAYQRAKAERHEFITLEHLLLALLEDAQAREALKACGGDPQRLASNLEGFLEEKLDRLPGDAPFEPTPTLGFHRVMEYAILHGMSSEQAALDSGSVLVALLREKDSHAAWFLRQEGVEKLNLTRFLSHGAQAAVGTPSPEPTSEDDGEAPAPDPLAAYAVDLTARAREGPHRPPDRPGT